MSKASASDLDKSGMFVLIESKGQRSAVVYSIRRNC